MIQKVIGETFKQIKKFNTSKNLENSDCIKQLGRDNA